MSPVTVVFFLVHPHFTMTTPFAGLRKSFLMMHDCDQWDFSLLVCLHIFPLPVITGVTKFGSTVLWVSFCHRLVDLVVNTSASRAEHPGFGSRLRQDFSGSSHTITSDLKIGIPVATLPCAWHYRVSAGTGQPGVSILWLGEVESLIYNFYLSVAARKTVWADPSLRYTRMLLGH